MFKKLFLCLFLSIGLIAGCFSVEPPVKDSTEFVFPINNKLDYMLSVVKLDIQFYTIIEADMYPSSQPTTRPTTSPTTVKKSAFYPTTQNVNKIRIYLPSDQKSLSGIVLKHTDKYTYIISAYHGIRGFEANNKIINISLKYNSDQRLLLSKDSIQATIVKAYPDKDLCILRTPKLNLPALTLYTGKYPEIGTELHKAGFKRGINLLSFDKAIVTNYFLSNNIISKGLPENLYLIRFSGFIEPGDSGGAIFTKDGKLLGMMVAFYAEGDGLALSTWEIEESIKNIPLE